MIDPRPAAREAAPLILRLALGWIFVYSGAMKLGILDGGGFGAIGANVHKFSDGLASMGVPMPIPAAWAAVLAEFLGGIFLVLGVLTRISAAGIICVMAVAIAKVHGQFGFMGEQVGNGAVRPGYAENMLIIAAALAVILLGPGPISLHEVFKKLERKKKGEGQ